MPHGEPHDSKKRKNWALFAVLITLITIIYAISLMRMGG